MMGITMQHVNPTGTRVFMGTLTGGIDLHSGLAQAARAQDVKTAQVHILGGLERVTFRSFDTQDQARKPPLRYDQPVEISGGHGTISLLDDDLHVHIHLTVVSRGEFPLNTMTVMAGHVESAAVYAVEFTLIAYDGAPARRQFDDATGLQLWHMPPVEDTDNTDDRDG